MGTREKKKAWFLAYSIGRKEKKMIMAEEREGDGTLFAEERLVAMEECWKEKEDLHQKHIEALLSTTKALCRENSML